MVLATGVLIRKDSVVRFPGSQQNQRLHYLQNFNSQNPKVRVLNLNGSRFFFGSTVFGCKTPHGSTVPRLKPEFLEDTQDKMSSIREEEASKYNEEAACEIKGNQ